MIVRNYREVRAEPVVEEPGVVVRWLVSQLTEAPHFALRLYELEPGAMTTTQAHYWEQDAFVLSGTGAVVGEEGRKPLGEGDVVYVSPGARHQFANTGSTLLRLLVVLPIVRHTAAHAGYGDEP